MDINNLLSNDKNNKYSQPDILTELECHGHPKSRKMQNKKQRNTTSAAEELARHYEYFYNKKRRIE